MIGPDIEPRPPRDPLQRLVTVLAACAGALVVATVAAEWVWRQVRS